MDAAGSVAPIALLLGAGDAFGLTSALVEGRVSFSARGCGIEGTGAEARVGAVKAVLVGTRGNPRVPVTTS